MGQCSGKEPNKEAYRRAGHTVSSSNTGSILPLLKQKLISYFVPYP